MITIGLLLLPAAPAFGAGPRVLVVDDDGVQCPGAVYTSIQPALHAARDGDTVRVCGGDYSNTGPLIVDRRIRLAAQIPAAPAVDCLAEDVTYPPTLSVIRSEMKVTASDVTIDGVVVIAGDEPDAGIFLIDTESGYRISRNVVDNTGFGIEVENSGAQPAIVENNCVRNARFVGIASQDGELRNAVVRDNITVGGLFGFAALTPEVRSRVSITGNTSRRDVVAIGLSSSVNTDITNNNSDSTGARNVNPSPGGMIIGSANVGLVIMNNTITGERGGPIYFQRGFFGDNGSASNVGLLVSGNRVQKVNGLGIRIPPTTVPAQGNVSRSLFLSNTVQNNVQVGFTVGDGSDNNVLIANTVSGNAGGIALNGAVKTVVLANTMTDNTPLDARDAEPSQNLWLANRCVVADPATLCDNDPTGARSPLGQSRGLTPQRALQTRPDVDESRWPCLRVGVPDMDPTRGFRWATTTVVAPDAPDGTTCT
jgi:parallel beta-helix repeat protein